MRARRVEVPANIRAVDTLVEPDYADAFEVGITGADTRTAEQWARATFEDAPRASRPFIVAGWTTGLGLRLGLQPSPDHVAPASAEVAAAQLRGDLAASAGHPAEAAAAFEIA